jgi:presenilin-like A22 family membrane protease
MLIVTSIVATGAGLRVAAHVIEGGARITTVAAVFAVAVPVVIFLGLLHALYGYLVRRFRALDAWLLITSTGIAMISVIAALFGISLAECLVVLMLAPAVTVIGYEVLRYRHQVKALSDCRAQEVASSDPPCHTIR